MPLAPLTDDRSPLRRTGGLIRATLLAAALFVLLIGTNVIQMLSLVTLPLSRSVFRRINRWCADFWWGLCVTVADRCNHTRFVLSGDTVPERENAIVVCNHQQMPDITTIMAFARSKHRLGDLKFFVKKALKWVPGMGWGMQFLDCLFIARDWAADQKGIHRTFSRIVDHQVPIWLVSFVEGTRVTEVKLARSQSFARDRGMKATRHVLLPRTKGFAASVEGLRVHATAVYDLTIGYENGVPTLWQYVQGLVTRIHVHVRRFTMDSLPQDEEGLRTWLLDRFSEKDDLLEFYYQHGEFPEESGQF